MTVSRETTSLYLYTHHRHHIPLLIKPTFTWHKLRNTGRWASACDQLWQATRSQTLSGGHRKKCHMTQVHWSLRLLRMWRNNGKCCITTVESEKFMSISAMQYKQCWGRERIKQKKGQCTARTNTSAHLLTFAHASMAALNATSVGGWPAILISFIKFNSSPHCPARPRALACVCVCIYSSHGMHRQHGQHVLSPASETPLTYLEDNTLGGIQSKQHEQGSNLELGVVTRLILLFQINATKTNVSGIKMKSNCTHLTWLDFHPQWSSERA